MIFGGVVKGWGGAGSTHWLRQMVLLTVLYEKDYYAQNICGAELEKSDQGHSKGLFLPSPIVSLIA